MGAHLGDSAAIALILGSSVIERAVAGRAVVLWLLLRLTVSAFSAAAGAGGAAFSPKASLLIVVMAGFLSRLDTRRRNEDLLLANLGTSPFSTNLLGFGPPLVLELTIAIVARL